jgi:hypothetical protein
MMAAELQRLVSRFRYRPATGRERLDVALGTDPETLDRAA